MKPCQVSRRTVGQAVVLEREVVEVVGVLGADERPVEVVDPGVVRALEADDLAARLLGDGRAPVAAHVVEGAQHAVAAAHDDERVVVELDERCTCRARRPPPRGRP